MPAVKQSTSAAQQPTPTAATDGGLRTLLALALLLPGVAAITYQLLWIRQLSLVVGIEVYSITVAVSAFFAGLAAGGAAFGKIADRVQSPLKLCALLELLTAALAVAVTFALPHAAEPFVWLQSHASILAWALPFLLVSVPAFAMGGTLPVAVQALRSTGTAAARDGGMLYAANTAGGILGALIAGFVLLPAFGMRGASLAAAAFNLVAAALAWIAIGRFPVIPSVEASNSPARVLNDPAHTAVSTLALILYGVAGAIALGYEVVWSQAISQFISTRAFAFAIVLAVYLAGLALGGWLSSRFIATLRDSWGIFALLIAGAGFVAMLEFAALGPWLVNTQFTAAEAMLKITGSQAARMYTSIAIAGLGIVFVPTLLLGAAFPVALRLIVGPDHVGRDVGRVVGVNTAGGIAGTLLTGFVLIPSLGLVRTLAFLAIGAALIGLLAAFAGTSVNSRMKWAVAAMAALAATAVWFTPANRLSNLLLATRGGGTLVFYEESRGATVAIAQQRAGDNIFRRLFIQGVSNSGDAMPSMRYMRLQAMLPLIIHDGNPKSVLTVGFGTGITAGATLRYPGLEKRVVAELLPAVVRSGEMFPENYRAWDDPQMQVRISDGRQELMRSPEQYDIITLEPPPPSAQGVGNLYSAEFYMLAKRRLAPKGLFAQWLPIATQSEDDTRSLVRSFLDVFPYATLWTTEFHEMLLIGSESPIRLDAAQISKRYATDTVTRSLNAVGIDGPAALLSTWIGSREMLEKFAAGARPTTDDRPRVEYSPWAQPNEIGKALPDLLALKTAVSLTNADASLNAEILTRRATLVDFYGAGLAAYNGDREEWQNLNQRVQTAEPNNAYYQWISGRD